MLRPRVRVCHKNNRDTIAPRVARRALASAAIALLLIPAIFPNLVRPQGQAPLRVDVRLVLLEATVKTKAGVTMTGLHQDDFIVTEDGASQHISHFSKDELPLAVALVVDVSESIRPFLQPLRDAATTALRALKPEDEVTLFTFSNDVQQRIALTKDKQKIVDEISTLTAGGSTNINGAIAEASDDLLRTAPNERRVIVLVSDNVPTDNGGLSSDEVTRHALAAGVSIYSLRVPGDNPLSDRLLAKSIRGLVNVGKLVQQTGGEIFDSQKEGSLFVAFQSLMERLKTRYTLGFYPTHKMVDGKFHRLDVRLTKSFGSRGQDYIVVSKKGYYASLTPEQH
jgi:Ca-activated chloride channel family protein